MTITSTANERIRFFKTLKTKKGRDETGTFLLEGRRAVRDALANGLTPLCVILEENEPAPDAACEVLRVSRRVLEALSDTSSPEGIMAQVAMPCTDFLTQTLQGTVVFLDRLQDPGNIGTIIRTADAAGAAAVIVSPECAELFSPKTVRASMSAVFSLPVMKAESSVSALRRLKANGFSLFAADMGGQALPRQTELPKKSCLMIGNEGNGLSPEVKAEADLTISLPMRGKSESLNAAVAAGILLYYFSFPVL
ncbi:MAG: RNA methyltransferase [Clostridia bacterium]|nr:RNA methyltransferase [Clostridia bacterium]